MQLRWSSPRRWPPPNQEGLHARRTTPPGGDPRPAGALAGAALGGALLLLSGSAAADQYRRPAEPSVLADSATDLTQVVDAFDEVNDFDLHLSLTFKQSTRSAPIYRETSLAASGSTTGYISGDLDVANYSETTNRLIPAADIGLFRDIALRVRLPIILSNVRSLSARGASSSDPANPPPALAGLPGEQLFSVPFESPTRSGIEYLAIGLEVGLMNQYRQRARPTWVVGFEGRFNVSEPMRACNASAGDAAAAAERDVPLVACAHPSDVNRDGIADPNDDPARGPLEGNFSGTRRPGVSRGTTGLEAHTFVSKRIKYVEPYGGLRGLVELPTSSSDFGSASLGASHRPPVRGSLVVGTAIVPWEIRERHQRLVFDTRLRSTYVSTGRDYSELFDALGSSSAASLRAPRFAGHMPNLDASGRVDESNPSVVDPSSRRVYFTGLTEVQHHARFELSGQFTWQAGEYVKFDVGGAWHIVQGHIITFDRPCEQDGAAEVTLAGPCKQNVGSEEAPEWSPTGTPNPNYRTVINAPGNRFRVGTSHGLDAWIRASVMF